MNKLVKQWEQYVEEKSAYPQIIGQAVPVLGIWGGLLPTYALPILSSAIWWMLGINSAWVWLGFILVMVVAVIGIGVLTERIEEKDVRKILKCIGLIKGP